MRNCEVGLGPILESRCITLLMKPCLWIDVGNFVECLRCAVVGRRGRCCLLSLIVGLRHSCCASLQSERDCIAFYRKEVLLEIFLQYSLFSFFFNKDGSCELVSYVRWTRVAANVFWSDKSNKSNVVQSEDVQARTEYDHR